MHMGATFKDLTSPIIMVPSFSKSAKKLTEIWQFDFFSIEWLGIGLLCQMSTIDFFVQCGVVLLGHLKDKNVCGSVIKAFPL